MRPAEFTQDGSSGMLVVLHALKWLSENEGYCLDFIILLVRIPVEDFR